MLGFKKVNRLNHDDCDDIYLINKVRRRKYDFGFMNCDDDEGRDAAWDDGAAEPKKREYEDRYQMQKVSDISVGRLNNLLKKDHLLMRFTSED